MLGIRRHHGVQVDCHQGDLTRFACDAMVNAANEALSGGGGVDGAIHQAGGPEIMAACRQLGGCPTGHAVVTTAGRLPARHVIHAVGPVWRGGVQGEAVALGSAVRAALVAADGVGARHVAIPAISTGVYGYPKAAAAEVCWRAIRDFAESPSRRHVRRVTVVLLDGADYAVFRQALAREFPEDDDDASEGPGRPV